MHDRTLTVKGIKSWKMFVYWHQEFGMRASSSSSCITCSFFLHDILFAHDSLLIPKHLWWWQRKGRKLYTVCHTEDDAKSFPLFVESVWTFLSTPLIQSPFVYASFDLTRIWFFVETKRNLCIKHEESRLLLYMLCYNKRKRVIFFLRHQRLESSGKKSFFKRSNTMLTKIIIITIHIFLPHPLYTQVFASWKCLFSSLVGMNICLMPGVKSSHLFHFHPKAVQEEKMMRRMLPKGISSFHPNFSLSLYSALDNI